MAKVFTPEQREELKARIVELVRLNGRGTFRQLATETGVSKTAVSRLSRELVVSGAIFDSGYGLFPSEQARKDWQNARKKLSRAKSKKPLVVDPGLIRALPDGGNPALRQTLQHNLSRVPEERSYAACTDIL